MTPAIIGAFFVLLGLGIVWRTRRKKLPPKGFKEMPRATGEVYISKHEGDLPGW